MDGTVRFTDVYVDDDIVDRAASVLRSTRYVKGPVLEEFEAKFAEFCGVDHAVGVSSGTAALLLAFRSAGVEAGDDVFVPGHTFFATASPVLSLDANPVFVDVDPETYTMDPEDLAAKAATAENPTAIAPVHLYGQPAPMDEINDIADRYGMAVVEDACQAHGATYRGERTGSLGDVGCFSFYPSKNMTVGGDGGMLVTDDAELAETARRIRNHGRDESGTHVELGLNYRLDEMKAAVGIEQLSHLDDWNAARAAAAAKYDERLGEMQGIETPTVADDGSHVYHLYVVRSENREALREHLSARDIQTGIHYETPAHLHSAVVEQMDETPTLPQTEILCEEILSLPMHPRITDEEIERVCDAIESFVGVPA
ncbi:hypothetical protein AUR64_16615 [Haloprofundus marisrubri]|uniref:Aminotransferase DegT n=1 Tax=Haloprofundus marisrubri TaxID=1514971 RepID=A0A0W1R7N6_9EURY|nr:DegT/DnrJ/EryC1/StrS family aminotransferase [Haloprofundus marisrubri]KTG09400.1 hypothetical protein AUR64_16615 [Haloprofundus marisrubri]